MAGWLSLLQPRTAAVEQHRLSCSILSLPQRAYGWHGFEEDADLVGGTNGAAGASAWVHEMDCFIVTTILLQMFLSSCQIYCSSFYEREKPSALLLTLFQSLWVLRRGKMGCFCIYPSSGKTKNYLGSLCFDVFQKHSRCVYLICWLILFISSLKATW